MQGAQATLDKLNHLANSLSNIININKNANLEDSPSGKYTRTYNQAEALAACGDLHSRKMNSIVETLDIDFRDGNKWCIDFNDVSKVRDHLGYEPFHVRHPDKEAQIWCVSSLKGGCGKTSTTVTIGSGLVYELLAGYRVLIIDLDPQGTTTMQLKPKFTEDELSVGDLLMHNYELEKGETFVELCKSATYETNVKNLKVMCARGTDDEYDIYVENMRLKANENDEVYLAYKDLNNIIDSVKDDFDIILIDTPPKFSAATLAAHYSAENLLIPFKASENDRDSSAKYFRFLARMYRLLAGFDHNGYKQIKVLQTIFKSSSLTQAKIAQEVRIACGIDMCTYPFPESEAVINAASMYSTIYDISPSEPSTKAKGLKKLQRDVMHMVLEFERLMLENWEIQNG